MRRTSSSRSNGRFSRRIPHQLVGMVIHHNSSSMVHFLWNRERSAAHLDQMQDDFIAQAAGVAGQDGGGAPVDHAAVVGARRPRPLGIGDLGVGDGHLPVTLDDVADQLDRLVAAHDGLADDFMTDVVPVSLCSVTGCPNWAINAAMRSGVIGTLPWRRSPTPTRKCRWR